MNRRLKDVLWVSGTVAAVALLVLFSTAAERHFHYLAMDMEPLPFFKSMVPSAKSWFCWLVVIPPVAWLYSGWLRGGMAMKPRLWRLAGMLLLASFVQVLLLTTLNFWDEYSWRKEGFGNAFFLTITYRFSFNLGLAVLLTGSAYLWEIVTRNRRATTRNARLQAQLSQARLDALSMQLQPHFLFNTLNAIASLMRRDMDAAETTLTRLARLLRSVLETSGQADVPLYRELDFLKEYLAIEETRFGNRLQVEWRIEPVARDARMPAFLLQPLVENAVKYAVAPRTEGGRIRIEAHVHEDELVMVIVDDGPGFIDSDAHGFGVGLRNTRERIAAFTDEVYTDAVYTDAVYTDAVYTDEQSTDSPPVSAQRSDRSGDRLILCSEPGGGTRVTIRLPLVRLTMDAAS